MLNRNQCANLCKIIKYVAKILDYQIICGNDRLEFGLLLNDSSLILHKSYFVVENCRKPNWYKEAIFQLNNKETFRSLLLDLKYCCRIIKNMLSNYYSNKFKDIALATFDVATCDKVEGDEKFLHDMLINTNREQDFEYYRLAKHLL